MSRRSNPRIPVPVSASAFSARAMLLGSLLFGTACTTTAARPTAPLNSSPVRAHVLRLGPGHDVMIALKAYTTKYRLKGASIASAVGSLKQSNLRFADQPTGVKRTGHFEITAMSGLLAESGAHIHMSIADEAGTTSGGHLLEENLVYTTLEVVLLEFPDLEFARERDTESGYNELVVQPAGH